MVCRTELIKQFQSLGVNWNMEVIDDCLEMCGRYSVDEQTMVETWLAFSLSHLSGADPTAERVQLMERKVFLDKENTPKSSKHSTNRTQRNGGYTSGSSPTSYGTPKQSRINYEKNSEAQSSSTLTTITTPREEPRVEVDRITCLQSYDSPSYLTPNRSTSKYANRNNSGQTVISYGNDSPYNWKGASDNSGIKVIPYVDKNNSCPLVTWNYMYDRLDTQSTALHFLNNQLAEMILQKNDMLDPLMFETDNSGLMSFVGRICSEDIKINPKSVTIEGNFYCKGRMEVDMTNVSEFSLFPGQIVAVQGKMVGKILQATTLYNSAPVPQLPVEHFRGPIQILVAAGPLTHIDTLSYEPLNDLINYAKAQKPDLLFIVGPLIDAHHTLVNSEIVTELFSLIYKRLLNGITETLKGTGTKVFYVASYKDVVNIPIYPTKPVLTELITDVTLLPDPSFLDVNGIIIGITSTDTLLHLGRREISNCGNRLHRLAANLIHQQNFYPLYPSDPEVGVECDLWIKASRFPVTPHLLILPSDLHNFIKVVNDCVVINPERLAKGYDAGGSFAAIEVRPEIDGEIWTPASHISAKIVKI